MVSDALKFGCVIAAVAKSATSALVGVPPPQLPVVLKSVPVFSQVLLAPCAQLDTPAATAATAAMNAIDRREPLFGHETVVDAHFRRERLRIFFSSPTDQA